MAKPLHITDQIVYRSLDTASRAVIDIESRTVEMSFASAFEVVRYDWIEVLDMTGMDMGRIGSGRAAFLVEHNRNDHVGVILSVTVGSDGIARAIVKFSTSVRGQEIFQDIVDGIRTLVSVGYQIHEIELASTKDGVSTYRVTRWEPHEISVVSIPADPTVGVGRALALPAPTDTTPPTSVAAVLPVQLRSAPKKEGQKMDEEQKAALAAAVAAANAESNKRNKEILDMGSKYDAGDMARTFVSEGKSIEEFRAALLDHKPVAQPIVGPTTLDLSRKDVESFSLARALNAMAAGNRALAPHEFAVSEATAQKAKRSNVQGILLPADISFARASTQVAGTPAQGGYVATEEHRPQDYIAALTNKLVALQMGVRVISNLKSAKLLFPKVDTRPTGGWVDEDGVGPETGFTLKQVGLTPKSYSAWTALSRSLMLQDGNFGVESFLLDLLVQSAAEAMDKAILMGAGGAEPEGILTLLGAGQKVQCGTDYEWAEIVEQETRISSANADYGRMGYIATSKARGMLKTKEKSVGTARYLWEDAGNGVGQVNGYNAMVSNVLKGAISELLFGNFGEVIFGLWSDPDIVTDNLTDKSGAHIVRIHQDAGLCIRNLEGFTAAILTP